MVERQEGEELDNCRYTVIGNIVVSGLSKLAMFIIYLFFKKYHSLANADRI